MEQVSFEGQVAIVTGGGRGLGRTYCLELGRRGASVVVNNVNGEGANAVVAEVEALGGTAIASDDSIATPEGGAAVVAKAVRTFGTVDAVVHNAGILRNASFEDLTLEQIDSVLDVNLRGAFFVLQPAWRVMKEKGYGRVVLTSSAAGMFSRPGSVNYSTAKAAMYGMCRSLSFEGADHGITVNMLLPRAASSITAGDPIPGAGKPSAALREAMSPRHLPEATTALTCYLLSRACEVTGEAYSSGYGVYARVFVGRAPGWAAPDAGAITIEDVVANLDRIRDLEGHTVPRGNRDEVETIARTLGIEVV